MSTEEEKPPAWAIALGEKVDRRFDALEANLELTAGSVQDLGHRMTGVEARIGKVEGRQETNSMRARAPSQHDLETAAALSQEIVAREALSTKVDTVAASVAAVVTENVAQTAMLTTLTDAAKKIGSNPTVHTIAILLGAAIIAWLKGHIQ